MSFDFLHWRIHFDFYPVQQIFYLMPVLAWIPYYGDSGSLCVGFMSWTVRIYAQRRFFI